MDEDKTVKRNVKDSVFTNLFKYPKYVAFTKVLSGQ